MSVTTCIDSLSYDISRYRGEIMGIAIFLIMLFHLGIFKYGSFGVDLFVFISGYSMFHSLLKDSDTLRFYKKRIVRILPLYCTIAIPYFLFNSNSVSEFLLRLTNIAVITDGYMNGWWFIGLIMICYFIAPFCYKMLKNGGGDCINILLIVTSITAGVVCWNSQIALFRLPGFIIGLYIASGLSNSSRNATCILLLCIASAIISAVFIGTNDSIWKFKNLFYMLLAYPTVLVLITLLRRINAVPIHQILSFLGSLTLEIYMIHEYFMIPFSTNIVNYHGIIIHRYVNLLLYSLLSIILAITIGFLFSKIMKRLLRVLKF